MEYDISSLRRRGVEVAERHETSLITIIENECYARIFTELRSHPKEKQRAMLHDFYGDFPNGEQIAERIFKINNIPWLSAENIGQHNKDYIRAKFSEHLDKIYPFSLGSKKDGYQIARDGAVTYAFRYGDKSGILTPIARSAAVSVARQATAHVADIAGQDFGWQVSWDAAWDVAHEVVSDKLRENPWDPLLDIYALGVLLKYDGGKQLSIFSKNACEKIQI